jgi:hypothetical protein
MHPIASGWRCFIVSYLKSCALSAAHLGGRKDRGRDRSERTCTLALAYREGRGRYSRTISLKNRPWRLCDTHAPAEVVGVA